jgi:hypothetical protein
MGQRSTFGPTLFSAAGRVRPDRQLQNFVRHHPRLCCVAAVVAEGHNLASFADVADGAASATDFGLNNLPGALWHANPHPARFLVLPDESRDRQWLVYR